MSFADTLPHSGNTKFARADLEAQLERISSHPKFLAANQLSRFLHYVVEATLAGRQDEIKQYTIGVEALGRDANFDPLIDAVVRTQASQLRRALHRYYATDGANDPIRIDIPKGRYVPIFLPNHDLRQSSDSRSEQPTSASAVKDPLSELPDGPSIAVLPLVFLGNDEDEAYFATGLTEEIIIALTRFPDFRVVGPLSREDIPERKEEIRRIGEQYAVRFVLDGTIRKRNHTFRMTARLTDAFNSQNLWGQASEYSLETTSLQQIEQDIVGQVVATIADPYGVIPRTLAKESFAGHTDSLSDYEAILRFHHHIRVLTETSQVEAFTALERLVQRDPHHAVAAALLGDLTASTYSLGYDDSSALLAQAETLGRKALALDPNCQQAYYTMALVSYLRFQRERCLEAIEHVLRLNPNHAHYLAAVSIMLAPMGDWERGLQLMRRSMRINPHHPGWCYILPFLDAYRLGEYEAALIAAQHFNTPEYFWDPLIRAAALGQLGRRPEARDAVDELFVLVPDFVRRGRSLMRRIVFLEENVAMLVAGLRKAGVVLEE